MDATKSFSNRTLQRHEDLWCIIKHLRQNPSTTKDKLISAMKAAPLSAGIDLDEGSIQPLATTIETDHGLAVDLAVRIFTMVNCFSQPRGISILEQGLNQVPWQSDIPFDAYIEGIFPSDFDSLAKNENRDLPHEVRSGITAHRLKKDLSLKFRPTDDLASHLKLDHQSNVLEVFQHTAILKEYLRVTKNETQDLSIADCLRL